MSRLSSRKKPQCAPILVRVQCTFALLVPTRTTNASSGEHLPSPPHLHAHAESKANARQWNRRERRCVQLTRICK